MALRAFAMEEEGRVRWLLSVYKLMSGAEGTHKKGRPSRGSHGIHIYPLRLVSVVYKIIVNNATGKNILLSPARRQGE